MNITLNLNELQNMFAVPSSIIDKHIKLASFAQIKFILYVLKNGTQKIDSDTANAIGITEDELENAVEYWVANKILTDLDAKSDTSTDQASSTKQTAAAIRKRIKPTREEIALRGMQSKEIAFLLNRAEQKFGRMLRQSEASTLVWLCDDEGMPVSVLLMLIEYAAGENCCTVGFIEKTAIGWINDGILDVPAAEKRIVRMRQEKKAWNRVTKAMGIEKRKPSAKEQQAAAKWVLEWGFSEKMLVLAYDACVDNTSKFSVSYINKILESWHRDGIDTPEKLNDLQNKKPNQKSASYKLDNIDDLLIGY